MMRALFFLLLFTCTRTVFSKSDFEPYQLNGGLVSAVAGRDYCLIASDTRLMDGGYEIYTRQHTSSRLWCANHAKQTTANMLKGTSSSETIQKSSLPVWIASSGCNADCEALKRAIQHESSAFAYHQGSTMTCAQVATLLSQTLYRRRSFPFYSFCVVSGLQEGQGAVYQYDAIGSYEQVAVATSGTGRELLQPILDRMFFSTATEKEESNIGLVKRKLPLVVPTFVDCKCEQAIDIVIRAYQSVAEREIGVGDCLLICVTQKCGDSDDCTVRTIKVPLKQH